MDNKLNIDMVLEGCNAVLELLVENIRVFDEGNAAKIAKGMDVGSEDAKYARDERLKDLNKTERALKGHRVIYDTKKDGHLVPHLKPHQPGLKEIVKVKTQDVLRDLFRDDE